MDPRKRAARVAGVLYLLLAVAAVVSYSYIPTWSMVGGDAAAAARTIAASRTAYRVAIVSDVAGQVCFVLLALALFELLQGVNRRHAVLMVAFVIVQVPMSFANLLLGMAPLVLLSGDAYLNVFTKPQLETLVMACLNLRGHGIRATMALWGLWLLPFGLLVFRSAFIPRVLGALLMVGCLGYLTVSVTSLLFPAYARVVLPLTGLAIGEILITLWLVSVGARTASSRRQS